MGKIKNLLPNKIYVVILIVVTLAGCFLYLKFLRQDLTSVANQTAKKSEARLLDSLFKKIELSHGIDSASLVFINGKDYLYFRTYDSGSGAASVRHGLIARENDEVYIIDYFGKYAGVVEGSDTIHQEDHSVSENLKGNPVLLYYLQEQAAIDEHGRVPLVFNDGDIRFIAEPHSQKTVVFARDTGDKRPSEDFGEGVDNYNQLVLWDTEHPGGDIIVQADEIKNMDVRNLPDYYPRDKITNISGPVFSLDDDRIYFTASAWSTSGAVFYYDFQTKKITYVCPGELKNVIEEGEHTGKLTVIQREYQDGGGVLYCDMIVDSESGVVIEKTGNCQ